MAKQFSNKEKALLTSIYNAKDSNTYVLTNVFAQWLDTNVGIRFDLEKGQLVYDYARYNDSDTILNIKKEIISTALFIKYLEDNGYIYIIQDDTTTEQPSYVGAYDIKNPISLSLPPEIAHIITRSLYNIYVSYDLRLFVENGFKTDEDLQLTQAAANLEASQKQIKISRWSLMVSALALVCTLIVSQYSNCTQEKHNKSMLKVVTQLDTNVCVTIDQNTTDLSAHVDSLGAVLGKQSTINIKKMNKPNKRRTTAKKHYNLRQVDTINCDGKEYIVLPIKNK